MSTMGVGVEVETTILQPPAAVAAFAGDPSNATQWYANIKSVDWQTPPPVAVGSRMDFVARFLGRRLAYTYEVVELESERRLVMRTADGPFPMETSYTWEPAGEGGDQDDAAQPGKPIGLLPSRGADHATCDETGHHQGPDAAKALLEGGERAK